MDGVLCDFRKGVENMFKLKSKDPIKDTVITTGKAMVLTTIIVSGGFLTLILSDFKGTFLVGSLVCLALFFALVSDLFLLPVILKLFFKNEK